MKHCAMQGLGLVLFLFGCNNRSPYYNLVMGKWVAKDSLTELVYEFEQDRYKRTGTYDTMEMWIEGSYFINENKERHAVTMCLVPDDEILLNQDYQVMMPVENLDIISISGDRMVVVRSNYVKGELGNTYQSRNDTLWRAED